MDTLSTVLVPPRFAGEDETILARMVHYVALGVAGSIGISLTMYSVERGVSIVSPILLGEIAIAVVSLMLNRWGKRTAAVLLLAMSLQLTATTMVVVSDAGFRDMAILIYPATLVAASLILGRGAYIAFSVTTMVNVTAIIFAGIYRLYHVPEPLLLTYFDLVDVAVILGMTSLAVGLLSEGIRRSLARARSNEAALSESLQIVGEQADRLKESERKYREVVEHASELIIVTNTHGRIQFVNSSVARVLEYPSEDMPGRNMLDDIPADDRERVADHLQAQLHARNPVSTVEYPVATRTGRTLWLGMSVSLVFDGSDVTGFHCVGRNISERKAAETKIRELNAHLEARVAERTEDLESALKELELISYSVSHDMRAPLRHIISYTHMLDDHTRTSLDSDSRRYLSTIMLSAQWMGGLVDGLLGYLRAGRGELQISDIDLMSLAHLVRTEVSGEAEGRNVTWDIGTLPRVRGDVALIRQVLLHLMHNALKFTRTRDEALIELSAEVDDSTGEAIVSIRDNGVGFEQEHAGKLFGVFQRLHQDGDFSGTGVGLAIVRRIIQRHGGRTWAEGVEDRGATVSLTLPIAVGEPLVAGEPS